MKFIGVVPGYKEYDTNVISLIFFSLFFAMIVSDGGYGLLLMLAALLAGRFNISKELNSLLYILSTTTIIWGAVTGTWFGSGIIAGLPVLNDLIIPEVSVADPDDKIGMYEGCLSIPDLRGYVERPAAVHVEAYNERGEKIAIDLEGFSAVVLQHECDHLDGILYIDRIEDTSQLGFEREVARFLDLNEDEVEDDSEQEASGAD